MPWYSSGTAAVTNNSPTVTGTGTSFSANARVGDAFRGPDGLWYEVTNVASATVISIKPNYQGANNAAGSYAIAPMQGYVKDSADALRGFVNQYGAVLAGLGPLATWQDGQALTLTGTGVRFKADMSNALVAARFAFQTNVPNSFSALSVIPNGTSQLTSLAAFNSSDPGSSSVGQIIVDGASVQLSSTRTGTGSYLPLTTFVSGLERERIITSGGHLFGTTSPNGVADASIANPGVFINSPSGTAAIQCITGEVNLWCSKRSITNNAYLAFAYQGAVTGAITTNGTTTAYNTSSDYRLKNTVEDLDKEAAVARIMAFRPVTWVWNFDGSPGKGFIAHWNQAVDPTTATGKKDEMRRVGRISLPDGSVIAEKVAEPEDMSPYGDEASWEFTNEEPVYQGRDDSKMIPDMVAMLQWQQEKILDLEAQLQRAQTLLPAA